MKQHFPSFRTFRTSRTAKTLTAAALALTLTGGTVAAALTPQPANAAAVSKQSLTRQAEKVSGSGSVSGCGITKEETVYVKTDAAGGSPSVTVSDWLKNVNGSGHLADLSDLTGITNLKGSEKFDQSGSALTWQTKNKDIYYQGQTDKSLPLSVHISYKLDGKPITAKDIAGKSGRLEMTIDYDNTSTTDGIHTPFAVATALNLPAKKFTDVQIDHGTVVADGTNNVTVGLAFPGLAENLGLAGQTRIQIPESVTITASVKNFAMGPTITSASTDVLEKAGLDKIDSFSDLDRAVNRLQNASAQLVAGSLSAKNGSAKLTAGAGTLASGLSTYTGGVATASGGSASLTAGANTLAGGLATLNGKTPALTKGVAGLYKGSQQLVTAYGNKETDKTILKGANDLASGTTTLKSNVGKLTGLNSLIDQNISNLNTLKTTLASTKTLRESLEQLKTAEDKILASDPTDNGAKIASKNLETILNQMPSKEAINAQTKQIDGGIETLKTTKEDLGKNLQNLQASVAQVDSGMQTLNTSLQTVAAGTSQLNAGLKELNANTGSLSAGVGQLARGSKTLAKGSKTLSDGLATLKANNAKLNGGASQLNAGSATLTSGLGSLYSGMSQFKTTGIDKLAGYYNHDFKGALSKLKTIRQAGKDYNNFSGKTDAMGGSVHFVIETSEIK
jgi:putative membrane protein